jgi:hypothetical protein
METTLAYKVGGFRFEPAEDRVTCGAYSVRLTPKASQTLLVTMIAGDAGAEVGLARVIDADRSSGHW